MPFIHIRALPFEESIDIPAVLEGVSRDFAGATGIEPRHVRATWDFMTPSHYVVGGKSSGEQPTSSHPILVDLLAPDFNESHVVETMLESIASSLAKRTGISRSNIFINYRQARSGMVFDAGKVERW